MKKVNAVILLMLGILLILVGSNWQKIGNGIVRNESNHVINTEKWKIRQPNSNQISHLPYGTERDNLSNPYKIWKYAHDNLYPLYLVGYVAIPSRNIMLPINHGSSNRVLAIGAGTLKDRNAPKPFNEPDVMGKSNYALCGHNMDDNYTLFSPIVGMQDGEKIYTTNGKSIFVYRKYQTQVVAPTDIQVIFNTQQTDKKPIITLTTCNWTGSKRYVIRGKLIRKIGWKQASHYQKRLFPRRSD